MIYYKYIIIYLILFSCISADEPIALITKSMGSVKYKNFSKNKFKVQAKVNSPILHGDGIMTGKKAFNKINTNTMVTSLVDSDIRECQTIHSSDLSEIFFDTLDGIDCYRDPFSVFK